MKEERPISLLKDYIISLSNLYGIVDREKVVEIYNRQNSDEATVAEVNGIMENDQEMLRNHYIYVHGHYFVHETIIAFNDFDKYMREKAGKPYYIPKKNELLKYKDEFYFERTKQYKDLLRYISDLLKGDRQRAEELCEDIVSMCQIESSIKSIFDTIYWHDIAFKDDRQVDEVMKLVMDLANHTRIWSNNGYTPYELFEKFEKPHLQKMSTNNRLKSSGKAKKIGRNDPCPCGSGKKYKRCCL